MIGFVSLFILLLDRNSVAQMYHHRTCDFKTMCYIVFISHSLHWRYIKTALQEYVIIRVNRPKRPFLILILSLSINKPFNFQINLHHWYKKVTGNKLYQCFIINFGSAPPSRTCGFDSVDGEAHSNGSCDRTLAECYKSILPIFQN